MILARVLMSLSFSLYGKNIEMRIIKMRKKKYILKKPAKMLINKKTEMMKLLNAIKCIYVKQCILKFYVLAQYVLI